MAEQYRWEPVEDGKVEDATWPTWIQDDGREIKCVSANGNVYISLHDLRLCRRVPQSALDAPDERDCEYWFDGAQIATIGQTRREYPLRGAAYVTTRYNARGAIINGAHYFLTELRGKWYKRDKAPWAQAQEPIPPALEGKPFVYTNTHDGQDYIAWLDTKNNQKRQRHMRVSVLRELAEFVQQTQVQPSDQ